MIRLFCSILAMAAISTVLSSCSESESASVEISKSARSFEVVRRITFLNEDTDKHILTIEGRCMIEKLIEAKQLTVMCKNGSNSYARNVLGLDGKGTYILEQMDGSGVGEYHYKVIYNPQIVLPDTDLVTFKAP